VIRNAVLHILNEQPMLADLFEAPSPTDVGLRCTNLRTMNLKRPVFIDDSAAIFFFPYRNIRFVEIPPGAISGSDPSSAIALSEGGSERDRRPSMDPPPDVPEPDLEIDEDFLRRIREV
jgi:hypothetical protein